MRLALIGVGLIGGSFARALRAGGEFDQILGFDTNYNALATAVELGIIDEAAESAAQVVIGASVVVIATPVGSTRQVIRDIAPHLQAGAIVTDVGSTKGSVVIAARDELAGSFTHFVPGHPIAGREHSGVEHADALLFRDKVFISTPVMETDARALDRVEALWRKVGCRVERMTPQAHDVVFAAVSHLPHVLAFALVSHIADQPDAQQKVLLAGSGFRDFTRIAASNSLIWSDICIANGRAIGDELRAYRMHLEKIERAINSGDREMLQRTFLKAAASRYIS